MISRLSGLAFALSFWIAIAAITISSLQASANSSPSAQHICILGK